MPDNILVLGLPDHGKTTFLAAAWHVLTSGEVPGSLRLGHLVGNRAYIEAMREAWVTCVPVPRTEQDALAETTLELVDGEVLGQLMIPDLSGELLERYWRERHWPGAFDDQIVTAKGMLLFVHPSKVQEGNTIEFAESIAAHIPDPSIQSVGEAQDLQPFSGEHSPSQVQLVYLLEQIVDRARPGIGGIPMVVVVSAWDQVPSNIEPRDWVQQRMPLLAQFLASEEAIVSVIVGISAQGGPLPDDRARLSNVVPPSQRILVVGHAGAPHDITWPFRWLLSRGSINEPAN
jgi:hypothetical protein